MRALPIVRPLAVLVLVLAACAGNESPGAAPPERSSTAETASSTTPAAPTPGTTDRPTTRPHHRLDHRPDQRPNQRPDQRPARRTPGQLQRQVEAMSVRQLSHRVQVVTVAGRAPHRVGPLAAAANRADFGVGTPAGVAERFKPGGVVYFANNVATADQVTNLSRGLHRAAARGGAPTLLFTDQEGGSVSRLPGPLATGQPAARDLGGDPAAGRASARGVGRAMAGMGLDVDFAPVADVDTVGGAGVIGDRAFGTGPAVVGEMVQAQTCGYHRGGVGVAVKHWPGHGSTAVDSHQALPTLTLRRSTWRREHLPPFVAGIRRGADLVMTGHLAYPRLDPSGRPATLSPELTRGWLRGRLGFDGVIVTDSLEMAALADFGSPGEVAVEALRAGADLLLMSPSPRAAAAGIREAVDSGELTRARLERSVLRVMMLADATGSAGGPRELDRCRG